MNDTHFPNELGSIPLEGRLSGRKLHMSNLKGGLAEKGCKRNAHLHPRHTQESSQIYYKITTETFQLLHKALGTQGYKRTTGASPSNLRQLGDH